MHIFSRQALITFHRLYLPPLLLLLVDLHLVLMLLQRTPLQTLARIRLLMELMYQRSHLQRRPPRTSQAQARRDFPQMPQLFQPHRQPQMQMPVSSLRKTATTTTPLRYQYHVNHLTASALPSQVQPALVRMADINAPMLHGVHLFIKHLVSKSRCRQWFFYPYQSSARRGMVFNSSNRTRG